MGKNDSLEAAFQTVGEAFVQHHAGGPQENDFEVYIIKGVSVPFLFDYLTPAYDLLYLINDKDEFLQALHTHLGSGGIPAITDPTKLGCRDGIGRIEDERDV